MTLLRAVHGGRACLPPPPPIVIITLYYDIVIPLILLHVTGPPVQITASVHSTPQRPFPFSHPVSNAPLSRTALPFSALLTLHAASLVLFNPTAVRSVPSTALSVLALLALAPLPSGLLARLRPPPGRHCYNTTLEAEGVRLVQLADCAPSGDDTCATELAQTLVCRVM
eukprot:993898-Prorocentrum_minimum.AAC.1